MKRKSILLIASIIVLASVIVAGATFAWFAYFRTSMIVVSGDAKISVSGWYQLVPDIAELNWTPGGDEDNNSKADELVSNLIGDNVVDGMSAGQFLAFKFKINNESDRDARLSLRLSDMTSYIYKDIKKFIDVDVSAATGATEEEKKLKEKELRLASQHIEDGQSKTLETLIDDSAASNTAKLMFIFDNIYYENVEGGVVTTTHLDGSSQDMYLWKYANGQRFIGYEDENDPLRPKVNKVFLPANASTYLHFVFANRMSTADLEVYRHWLTSRPEDTDTEPRGTELAANYYDGGYAWAGLPDNIKTLIIEYLEYFYMRERDSISGHEEELTRINLSLEYFEFIGENIPID